MNHWRNFIQGFRARSLESHKEERERLELQLEFRPKKPSSRTQPERKVAETFEPPSMSGDPDIDDVRYL
tara:strand:- start:339 stop:545 length:207 start_codon:yes stop_codon:yes gene_type:complete